MYEIFFNNFIMIIGRNYLFSRRFVLNVCGVKKAFPEIK